MRSLAALLLLVAAPAVAQDLTAGQQGEWFFLASPDRNFVLLPSGRFQMDFLAGQAGNPHATFLPKRARLEAFGTLLHHVDFQLGAEFTFGTAPVATDEVVILNFVRWAQLQFGQFDAPFSMDNRTSDKFFDLMERTNAVRAFAIPENKMTGAMVWGMPENRQAYWSAGVFNGDGINEYPNRDSRFDVLGRAWIAPFGHDVWVGGSAWYGDHAPTAAQQVDRGAMKDQAGFTFFDTKGIGHFGTETKWGLELNAPVGPLVLKAEYLHGDEGLREVAGGVARRTSRLAGAGWYVRASFFPFGDPLINGLGGQQLPPHPLDDPRPSKLADALQLVAQWDHVGFAYTPDGAPSAEYRVDSLALGVNYWWTRHVRFTAIVLRNWFDGPGPRPLGPDASGPRGENVEVTGRIGLVL